MSNLIKKKWLGADQVDGSKILLENQEFIRVKRQNGTVEDLLKFDASDNLIVSQAPLIQTPSTAGNAAQTKDQVDGYVAAEAALRTSADAAIQGEVDALEAALAQEVIDRGAGDTTLDSKIDQEISDRQAADALLIPLSQKGAANGVATLDGAGLIPANQLPSYVDDVLEFADLASFPGTGESGKIYVALDSLKTYRWSGSVYAEISPSDVNSVNGQVGAVVLDSDDISEGSSNLYFTEARAQAANDARFLVVEGEVDALETSMAAAEGRLDGHDADIADHETRINALEVQVPSWNKMKFVLDSTDVSNAYIDLAHEVVPSSITAFVDRLGFHEGAAEDFTVSTVGGVSRISFVTPAQMDVGDNLYFKYQY